MSGLNSFLKIFMPKNTVFFELFEQVAENLGKMGIQLKAVVAETDIDKRAALIAVIEDGQISEWGSHEELLSANGAYSKLWRSWRDESSL